MRIFLLTIILLFGGIISAHAQVTRPDPAIKKDVQEVNRTAVLLGEETISEDFVDLLLDEEKMHHTSCRFAAIAPVYLATQEVSLRKQMREIPDLAKVLEQVEEQISEIPSGSFMEHLYEAARRTVSSLASSDDEDYIIQVTRERTIELCMKDHIVYAINFEIQMHSPEMSQHKACYEDKTKCIVPEKPFIPDEYWDDGALDSDDWDDDEGWDDY